MQKVSLERTEGQRDSIDSIIDSIGVKPYSREPSGVLYCGDCLEIMKGIPDGAVDAVITDPPYGVSWVPRVNLRVPMEGDDRPFDPTPFLSIGNKHLFWGGIHFSDKLPSSESWFVWLKQPPTFDECRKTYSPCDLAWSDFGGKPRIKHQTWDGNFRSGVKRGEVVHPAQKPIEIMRWCVDAVEADIILDPFAGSGTTLVAAKQLGRRYIGIEIDPEYCEIARDRLRQEELF